MTVQPTKVIRYTTKGFPKKEMTFVKKTLDDERGLAHKGLGSSMRHNGFSHKGVVYHTYQFKRCRKPHTPDVIIALTKRETMDKLFGDTFTLKGLSVTDRGLDPMRIYIDDVNWHTRPQDFRGSLKTYRQYLIQHEMGHCLGLDHDQIITGQKCPVMYQQTKGTKNCKANPWFTKESGLRQQKTKKTKRDKRTLKRKMRFISQ
jgi:hypothetical protein